MSVHRNIITNYNQQDETFLDLCIFTNAPNVSGGSSAHHQEHITVHTASIPEAYVQLSAPDDGRRNRLNHVERYKNK
jgi:5-deoxy-D-glucuronate isomerase